MQSTEGNSMIIKNATEKLKTCHWHWTASVEEATLQQPRVWLWKKDEASEGL